MSTSLSVSIRTPQFAPTEFTITTTDSPSRSTTLINFPFGEQPDKTSTPPRPTKRSTLLQDPLSTPKKSDAISRRLVFSATKTASSPSPTPACKEILSTPIKRYTLTLQTKQKNGERYFSVRGAFSPGMKNQIKKNPNQVYSIKTHLEASDSSPARETRQIGETGRGIIRRVGEHACSDSKTAIGKEIRNVLEKTKTGRCGSVSIGVLKTCASQEELDRCETEAIEKGKKVFGETLLNKRKGGGGGAVVQDKPTLCTKQAKKLLIPLLDKDKISWKFLRKTKKHTITCDWMSHKGRLKNALYIFERTLTDGSQKRYVGITEDPFQKRLGEHLHLANHLEKMKRKDASFYTDLHANWQEFRVGAFSIQPLIEKGATIRQLEKIAIHHLQSRKGPDGSGGYNLNNGGGGGASKKNPPQQQKGQNK